MDDVNIICQEDFFILRRRYMSWSEFFWGIGLFMFGMLQFEQAIKQLGGKTIKHLLQKYTDKVRKWVSMGIGLTALAQSSTVVSLIVTGFVGAGILSLHNAMSVVVGANLGATITPWMIVVLGFKTDIFGLAFYLVGIGAIGLIFSDEYGRRHGLRKLIFGFGLMFLGLHFLKEAVSILTTHIDMSILQHASRGAAIGIGLLLAFVIQTSAAVSVITLAALQAQLISFELAMGIMIGSNMWSALSTALMGRLSSSGNSRSKKQLMIGHVLFNVVTAGIVVLLLPRLVDMVQFLAGGSDPVLALAIFHTLFNVTGVVLLAPCIGLYSSRITRVLPTSTGSISLAIHEVATTMPEEVLVALEKDTKLLWNHVHAFIQKCFGLAHTTSYEEPPVPSPMYLRRERLRQSRLFQLLQKESAADEHIVQYHPESMQSRMHEYEDIKRIESAVYNFTVRLSNREFINGNLHKLMRLEEKVDALLDAAKIIKENMHHIEHIADIKDARVVSYRTYICQAVQKAIEDADDEVTETADNESDKLLYEFLQEHILAQEKQDRDTKELQDDDLSEQDIAEILKTNRHIQHVVNLLRTNNSSGISEVKH